MGRKAVLRRGISGGRRVFDLQHLGHASSECTPFDSTGKDR